VVEYNHSQLHLVVDRSEAQFITNFHLTDRSLGWYPCARYARMESFFGGQGNKEDHLVDLLDSIHQEREYPTVYSYVFDLGRRQLTVFFRHDYQKKKVLSLDELIESDRVFDIIF